MYIGMGFFVTEWSTGSFVTVPKSNTKVKRQHEPMFKQLDSNFGGVPDPMLSKSFYQGATQVKQSQTKLQ